MRALFTGAVAAFIITLATPSSADFLPIGQPFQGPVVTPPGISARVIFNKLPSVAALAFDSANNLLAVQRGIGVSVFTEVTSPAGWERTVLIKNTNLTYGIQVDGTNIYLSTATNILVYKYNATTRSIVPNIPPFPAVVGLLPDGEFSSHPILLERDATGKAIALLVGEGPAANIDPTARDPASGRSQIRRFLFPNVTLPVFPPIPFQWKNGVILGHGLRNPAGFAFNPTAIASPLPVQSKELYVVDNGASIDEVKGFTPVFANDNPSDELDLITLPSATVSYGFPDCISLWNPTADPVGNPQYTGLKKGTQVSLNLEAKFTDKWCQDKSNNRPPALDLQAHSSPVDIKFYEPTLRSTPISSADLPASWLGHAFVSFFGSFGRDPPTGYGVVRIPFPLGGPSIDPLGYSFIVQAAKLASCPENCITPVGLAFSKGKLYVSSDLTGEIFVVQGTSFVTNP